MKISEELLRELALLADTDRTVLSAYLDVTAGWGAAADFIGREESRLTPLLTAEERGYLEGSLASLSDFVGGKEEEGYGGPGLAFFADLGADFARGVELAASPEPLLAVDEEAIIAPLALQLDEYEPVGVIMADASGARVLIAAGRRAEEAASLREKIHPRSKVGGWSQRRYQRRREKEVKRFAEEVASRAEEVFREAGVRRLLLAGRDRIVGPVEEALSKAWRERVVGSVRWDLDAPDDEFLSRVRPLLEAAEREEEKEILARLCGELRRGGLAAAGPEAVARALRRGAGDVLILGASAGGAAVEELTSLAEATGAHVEFVAEENEALAAGGGVGALLRYKIG